MVKVPIILQQRGHIETSPRSRSGKEEKDKRESAGDERQISPIQKLESALTNQRTDGIIMRANLTEGGNIL